MVKKRTVQVKERTKFIFFSQIFHVAKIFFTEFQITVVAIATPAHLQLFIDIFLLKSSSLFQVRSRLPGVWKSEFLHIYCYDSEVHENIFSRSKCEADVQWLPLS